jgi:hypothetical protein
LQFERAGLFDLVQKTYHCTQVFYTVCFVHIIRFIAQDFTAPLPLPQESSELLISIFASGAAEARKGYLKSDSLQETNRRQEVTNIDFELVYYFLDSTRKCNRLIKEYLKR